MFTYINNDKVEDLKKAWETGKEFNCNHSPTMKGKIVGIHDDKAGLGYDCVIEVTTNKENWGDDYNTPNQNKIGTRFTLPSYIVWNSIYF